MLEAKRRTFGTIDARRDPARRSRFAERAAATASEDAFHVAVGIGAGLLVIAGIGGGIGLRTQRRSVVAAGECAGGQLCGAPRALDADRQPVGGAVA